MTAERKARGISGLVGFAIGALVAGAVVVVFFSISISSDTVAPTRTVESQTATGEQIAGLRAEIQTLREQLDSISKEAASPNSNLDVAALKAELKSLDRRLTALEQVVLDNPSKAVELTILQHDIENLKATYKADQENLHAEIARVYDQNKWFLGLIATMSLAVVSLVIGNFLRKPEKSTPSDRASGEGRDVEHRRASKSPARGSSKARSGELRVVKKPRVGREFVEMGDDDILN